jgi:hypothetical protein
MSLSKNCSFSEPRAATRFLNRQRRKPVESAPSVFVGGRRSFLFSPPVLPSLGAVYEASNAEVMFSGKRRYRNVFAKIEHKRREEQAAPPSIRRGRKLILKFQRELDNSGIAQNGVVASERAPWRIEFLSTQASGGQRCVRYREVWMVKQIEEFCAELQPH